jgi:hypothetical protein
MCCRRRTLNRPIRTSGGLASALISLALLVTPCLAAETAPGDVPGAPTAAVAPAAPAPAAVDEDAIEALKEMGAFLQTLTRFEVKTSVTGESVLMDGQKLQRSASAELQVVRPNKLRAVMRTAAGERQLIYDGRTATLYTPALKLYASAEAADSLRGAIKGLKERYGIDVPLADLFLWGTDAAPVDAIQSAIYVGEDLVDGDLCDQYAFRQGNLDWQIWIDAGERALPRKLVITNRADEARPQSVSVITWNLEPAFADAVFTFTPPQDASRIVIRQLSGN